jgi:hypothetical protein
MFSVRIACTLLCFTILGGCASFEAPPYSPDYQAIDRLKSEPIELLSVGEFSPMSPQADVNRISLRGSGLKAKQGTFAEYLQDAVRSDLIELGVYDANSPLSITATILENDIDVSGLSEGFGIMKVHLLVKRNDQVVFDQIFDARTEFPSSFAGAVAIPKGQQEYPNLVKALLNRIYIDVEFIKAVSKK